jgi:hypothetical protein
MAHNIINNKLYPNYKQTMALNNEDLTIFIVNRKFFHFCLLRKIVARTLQYYVYLCLFSAIVSRNFIIFADCK